MMTSCTVVLWLSFCPHSPLLIIIIIIIDLPYIVKAKNRNMNILCENAILQICFSQHIFAVMAAINKDVVLIVSLALSVVSLVLLFGVTWYFQSSLELLQQQVEYDRELLFKLQEQINVSIKTSFIWLDT